MSHNSESIDRICKPFTYRAHYIESIIERPKQEFDVRVRVLFRPIEENAYTLIFGLADDSFYLKGFRKSDVDDWFRPWETEAKEIARKFIFAAKSGRQDVISHLTTKSLDTSLLLSKYHEALQENVIKIENPNADMVNYKGLKIQVKTESKGAWLGVDYLYWTFLIDRIEGEFKIVKWKIFKFMLSAEAEDPNLESYTLKRFRLSSSPLSMDSQELQVPEKPAESMEAKSYYDQGVKEIKEKRYDQAIENFSKAIASYPNYVKAYNARGIAYRKKEQYDKAIEDYSKAISLDPDYAPAYTNRGVAYAKKGEYDKAIAEYNKVIALDAKHIAPYYNLACIYSLQGNESTACETLNKAVEKGYKNWAHIKRDSDLDNIRNSACYKRIMSGR